MFLIVGLGNPGKIYQASKHNAGFMAIDQIVRLIGQSSRNFSKSFESLILKARYKRHRLILVKPQTFMNLCGRPVAALARYFKISPEKIIVAHDDLDLEAGRLKIKFSGGLAGHRGLDSIVENLGSRDFVRIRVGIGRGPTDKEKEYVLAKFNASQKAVVKESLQKAAQAALLIIDRGLATAMNLYNS